MKRIRPVFKPASKELPFGTFLLIILGLSAVVYALVLLAIATGWA